MSCQGQCWCPGPQRLRFMIGPVVELLHPEGATQPPKHRKRSRTDMQITDSQQFTLMVTGGIDRAGNPVPGPVPGVLAWSSTDETLVTVAPAADGLSALVAAVGNIGSGTIVRVTDDVDGDGTGDFEGSLVVDVALGQIVSLTLEAGEVTEKA